MIKLKDICKSYDNKIIFDNFNAELCDGDFIVIIGDSGKGKTTLLNIIGLIEPIESGQILIDEKPAPKINSKEWRNFLKNDVAFVFQNFGLIDHKTVYQNLRLGIPSKTKQEIVDALRKVGLEQLIDTKIYSLSGGEQQRIALSKVLLKNPKMVLADEPTGNLDNKNKEIALRLLKKMQSDGKTIIMVTHDHSICKFATKIIEL